MITLFSCLNVGFFVVHCLAVKTVIATVKPMSLIVMLSGLWM